MRDVSRQEARDETSLPKAKKVRVGVSLVARATLPKLACVRVEARLGARGSCRRVRRAWKACWLRKRRRTTA